MTSVPWAWIQRSSRTNRPGRAATAPRSTERLRSVNGSRRLGTNSEIASVTCTTRMYGKSDARFGIPSGFGRGEAVG